MPEDKVQIAFKGTEAYRYSLQQEALKRKMKVQDLLETAVEKYLSASGAQKVSGPETHQENLIQTKSSAETPPLGRLPAGEPSEWASLATRASHVQGRIERSMYRSIRFQLEYLALVAQQQGINAPPIKIRYDDDGNLVVPVSDPSSPLHPPSGVEKPRRTAVGPVREDARPEADSVPKRRKAAGE